MKNVIQIVCVAVIVAALGSVEAADVFNMPTGLTNLEFVTVGDPGNPGEPSGHPSFRRVCGAVDYEYRIGKYEVTAGQYTEFLNAVAETDTYGLYDTYMWEPMAWYEGRDFTCKIERSGASGNYTYSVAVDRANRPVTHVTWGDAARFANWLHNGQPTGAQDLSTTEDGSYYLNGANTNAELIGVTRKVGATFVIPSEDEWYKAAYYKGGSTDAGYWDYPTGSDSVPSNKLINPDPGNNANYVVASHYTISSPYWRTEVGEFENSDSPYGTFDQGGNVEEFNEAVLFGADRGKRGGQFWSSGHVDADSRSAWKPEYHGDGEGFRVAQVPEPATLGMLALGGLAVLRRKRSEFK